MLILSVILGVLNLLGFFYLYLVFIRRDMKVPMVAPGYCVKCGRTAPRHVEDKLLYECWHCRNRSTR